MSMLATLLAGAPAGTHAHRLRSGRSGASLVCRSAGSQHAVHHRDRAAQYVSIRYSERLGEAGIEPSVGSKGDSHGNALAETINGLYKAEIIPRRGPWKTKESVELVTLERVSWFNHYPLLGPIGSIPPAEAEANDYRCQIEQAANSRWNVNLVFYRRIDGNCIRVLHQRMDVEHRLSESGKMLAD